MLCSLEKLAEKAHFNDFFYIILKQKRTPMQEKSDDETFIKNLLGAMEDDQDLEDSIESQIVRKKVQF